MKIQELLSEFYDSSSTVSSLTRQLAFAGIAIIWVLRVGEGTSDMRFPQQLLLPLYCFAGGMVLDFAQYLYKTMIYGLLNFYHWRIHRNNETSVEIPGIINLLSYIFFIGKILAVGYAYMLLLCYLDGRIAPVN